MGCDIHLHCEYRKNGIWYNCDNFEWNQETGQYEFVSIYSDRNYILFGVLAGVRSNEPEKIDSPRGLPDDIALKTKELADLDFKWTHSHSYLTLRELLKWRERQQKKWRTTSRALSMRASWNPTSGPFRSLPSTFRSAPLFIHLEISETIFWAAAVKQPMR